MAVAVSRRWEMVEMGDREECGFVVPRNISSEDQVQNPHRNWYIVLTWSQIFWAGVLVQNLTSSYRTILPVTLKILRNLLGTGK